MKQIKPWILNTILMCITVCLCLDTTPCRAQTIHQTVRGKIIDADSRVPLPGATVMIVGSTGLVMTTDAGGNFRIDDVPVGRISLAVRYIGYEEIILPNILVTSGKETVLDLSLRESLVMMEALEITSDQDKSEVANDMAVTSTRGFTVEETKRYAGSFNDPARMVSAFAGVDTDPSGENSIIVRGNSPKGIQWRLEGIDIPNPNHFSEEGATGGPINALNSQMLSNSEFYTGAFAPEYGNALSGVFDMKLRKGNNEHHEHSFSLGALGTEATLEGPIGKETQASYLLNYRYATLSLLNNLGLVDYGGVPRYQDLSFKVFVPTTNLGTFSLFGLGGKSNIREEEFADGDEEKLLERGDFKADMGVVGITQYWSLDEKTFLQNSVSVSQNGSGYREYKPNAEELLWKVEHAQMNKRSFKAASTLHHKFNGRHTVQGGLIYTHHHFNFFDMEYNAEWNQFVMESDHEGKADQFQGFVSWKFRASEKVSIVSGVHAQQVSMNDEISVEPRASMRWQFHPSQALTAGFGLHGKPETLPNYYSIIHSEDGTPSMPNQALGFSKARHYVIGYENNLAAQLLLKLEAYFQQLYNIPIEDRPNSAYSLINQSEGFTDRVLVNEGTGRNMGIEMTVERYFADDYYFLVTASLFDSKYTAMDGIERNTPFNGRSVANVLFGKEFKLSTTNNSNKVLGFSVKLSSLGARRFTPIDTERSIAKGRTVYYEAQAYTDSGDNVFIANIALSYRIDNRKISQELKLDLQNATNNAAKIGQYFDHDEGKIKTIGQLPILPVVIYTIHF